MVLGALKTIFCLHEFKGELDFNDRIAMIVRLSAAIFHL